MVLRAAPGAGRRVSRTMLFLVGGHALSKLLRDPQHPREKKRGRGSDGHGMSRHPVRRSRTVMVMDMGCTDISVRRSRTVAVMGCGMHRHPGRRIDAVMVMGCRLRNGNGTIVVDQKKSPGASWGAGAGWADLRSSADPGS